MVIWPSVAVVTISHPATVPDPAAIWSVTIPCVTDNPPPVMFMPNSVLFPACVTLCNVEVVENVGSVSTVTICEPLAYASPPTDRSPPMLAA